jgi:predicted Zn-dependent peptidase
MDARQLVDSLDGLGLHRCGSVNSSHLTLSCAMEVSSLSKALDLYADIILRPALDTEQFELSKQLATSDVIGLDDDPHERAMVNLREQFYPSPLGLPTAGRLDEIEALTAEKAGEILKRQFNMPGTIFAVAGKYDFAAVCEQMERLFDIEQSPIVTDITTGDRGQAYTHIQHDGAQVHIGLMTETVPFVHEDYYNAMAAISILSGGMSSRLFTEVREKRGLCYAVGASYNTRKTIAGINCYAGTTPDKAQETLDVIKEEFSKLSADISECEMQRAKVGLKSSLIMRSESSSARSGGAAGDYHMLGRVRSIDEIKEKIELLNIESVTRFLNENAFKNYTVVTIGPKAVNA